MNYIDINGEHHTLQGLPEHKFDHNIGKLGAFIREEIFSDGRNNTDSPFQRLRVNPQHTDSEVSLDQPYTMVAEGDDLSSRWALMRDFADEVNSTGYEYRPISQNSNSFAGGALERAGFFGPGTEFPERFNRHPVVDPRERGNQIFLSRPANRKLPCHVGQITGIVSASQQLTAIIAPAPVNRPRAFCVFH